MSTGKIAACWKTFYDVQMGRDLYLVAISFWVLFVLVLAVLFSYRDSIPAIAGLKGVDVVAVALVLLTWLGALLFARSKRKPDV